MAYFSINVTVENVNFSDHDAIKIVTDQKIMLIFKLFLIIQYNKVIKNVIVF